MIRGDRINPVMQAFPKALPVLGPPQRRTHDVLEPLVPRGAIEGFVQKEVLGAGFRIEIPHAPPPGIRHIVKAQRGAQMHDVQGGARHFRQQDHPAHRFGLALCGTGTGMVRGR